MQLQTEYNQGERTGSYAGADRIQGGKKDSCRQDTRRKERQGAVQLQTGYREGGKTGELLYVAADRIQT
jgi:hypothetical protein